MWGCSVRLIMLMCMCMLLLWLMVLLVLLALLLLAMQRVPLISLSHNESPITAFFVAVCFLRFLLARIYFSPHALHNLINKKGWSKRKIKTRSTSRHTYVAGPCGPFRQIGVSIVLQHKHSCLRSWNCCCCCCCWCCWCCCCCSGILLTTDPCGDGRRDPGSATSRCVFVFVLF